MRIGQLARRLGIPPTEILAFLGTQNIEAEGGTNSRLMTDVVAKVINHFAPEKLSEILTVPAEEPAAEVVAEVTEVVIETPEPPVAETPQPETEPEVQTPPEVIRVAKVELQGLKVLGKIDLPEKKKKVEETPAEPRTEYQSKREFQKRREREWKNPLELKRQQEEREKEERKREDAEKLKEKRTNHYYSKVKSVPTKAVRRFEEATVIEDVEMKEAPKGLFGRFLRWLRT